MLHSSLWDDLFCVVVWTHEQRYQSCVAPAVTLLFCLRVISLKSLICSFVNLFSCCWHKSEWFHRPGQASESVAFGAAGFKVCLFSLRRKRRSRQLTFLMLLLSIKAQRASLLLSVLAHGVDERDDWWEDRESKGDICAGLSSHWADLGHSCTSLQGADGKRRGMQLKGISESVNRPHCVSVINKLRGEREKVPSEWTEGSVYSWVIP